MSRRRTGVAKPSSRAAAVAAAVLLLASGAAAAHDGSGLPGGFAQGFRHPFGGADHQLAMVSVGLWGAFLGRPLIHRLPLLFPVVMAGGGALGMLGLPWPSLETGIALSVLVLGGCIALGLRAPAWAALSLVAFFALFHGYAHGRELPSAADPVGYSLGFVLATGLLHLLGIALGALNARPGGVAATRGLGGAIAIAGGAFLYKALAA